MRAITRGSAIVRRARDRSRRLLLDAALRVLAREGAGAAAIHEVAAEAGVSNGTFCDYLRTREGPGGGGEAGAGASTLFADASAVAALALRVLGVEPEEADAIAGRPLPGAAGG